MPAVKKPGPGGAIFKTFKDQVIASLISAGISPEEADVIYQQASTNVPIEKTLPSGMIVDTPVGRNYQDAQQAVYQAIRDGVSPDKIRDLVLARDQAKDEYNKYAGGFGQGFGQTLPTIPDAVLNRPGPLIPGDPEEFPVPGEERGPGYGNDPGVTNPTVPGGPPTYSPFPGTGPVIPPVGPGGNNPPVTVLPPGNEFRGDPGLQFFTPGVFGGQFQDESGLFNQTSMAEQKALEDARNRYLNESQTLFSNYAPIASKAFQPIFEENIKKGAGLLGAQGLGSGGFQGSGAAQELVARELGRLGESVTRQALPGLFGAGEQFGQLGVQAGTTPSLFGRARLERQLGLGDTQRQMAHELNLAQLGADAQRRAGRENTRSGLFTSVINALPSLFI